MITHVYARVWLPQDTQGKCLRDVTMAAHGFKHGFMQTALIVTIRGDIGVK